MKKFNKNIILFIFAACMVISGYNINFIKGMGRSLYDLVDNVSAKEENPIRTFTKAVENYSSERLSYHGLLMDVNSLKDRLLGTRVVTKDGKDYFRTDDEYLVTTTKRKVSKKSYANTYEQLKKLQKVSEDNGAGFMYYGVPVKSYFASYTPDINEYSKENYDVFIEGLEEEGIAYMDFASALGTRENPLESYYATDHHWTVREGLNAANEICKNLNDVYGYTYDKGITNIDNYEVELYKDHFLGSYGKKVGTYFTSGGADDFEYITPKFKTSLIEEQPFKKQVREGSFEESVVYQNNLKKDYYGKNPYATYSGGDFRLQIIKNKLNESGEKVLVIRDSFACVVTPFLALQTSELHVCDVRNYEYFVGEKLNMEEYIKEINPDYVIVLYSGTDETSGRYDFF